MSGGAAKAGEIVHRQLKVCLKDLFANSCRLFPGIQGFNQNQNMWRKG